MRGRRMKLVTISDLHGSTTGFYELASQEGDADWLFISGDITHFGGPREAADLIAELRLLFPNILAVPGNCDHPDTVEYLRRQGMNLHGEGRVLDGVGVIGAGGGLFAGGHTLLELGEEAFEDLLKGALKQVPDGVPFLMLVHNPPYGTQLDRVHRGHVGSRAIRQLIETHHPLVCFSGHIHEATGTDRLNGTLLANPGPLRQGGYVVTELEDGQVVHVEIRNWRESK